MPTLEVLSEKNFASMGGKVRIPTHHEDTEKKLTRLHGKEKPREGEGGDRKKKDGKKDA